jgi:GTP-binding protein Era
MEKQKTKNNQEEKKKSEAKDKTIKRNNKAKEDIKQEENKKNDDESYYKAQHEKGREPKIIRSGYIACVGRPNVGKSTLINKLVGAKISAVSPKPQTTRRAIIGIKTIKDDKKGELTQMAFIDTPGLHKPRNELGAEMVRNAIESLKMANIIYHLIDSSEGIQGEDIDVAENLKSLMKEEKIKVPIFCILTKIDLIRKENLLPMMKELGKWGLYAEIIPVSALKGEGIDDLIKTTERYLPETQEILFPYEMVSGQPLRIIIQEIIMEKIYNYLHMEIPYSVAVEVEEIDERENGVLYIKAIIYVERQNQKKIVIGKDGSKIKQIGTLAREEIEFLTGRKVYLDLWVRVKEDWRKNVYFVKKIYFSE